MSYGVGIFGGNRRTERAPSNPLDKSTVVSIYPRNITEFKHTIQPGKFVIKSGSFENPAMLVVGSSSWWKDVSPEEPLLEIPHWSNQIANSIVRDWANGLFMCDMGESMPGLFWVAGEIKSIAELKEKHIGLLLEAKRKQNNWYHNLVTEADGLWARTNGNPIAISDDMRLAAEQLNLKEKAWMKDFTMMTLINCPACGQLVKPGYPVCASCNHIVDAKLYEQMGLKKAG